MTHIPGGRLGAVVGERSMVSEAPARRSILRESQAFQAGEILV